MSSMKKRSLMAMLFAIVTLAACGGGEGTPPPGSENLGPDTIADSVTLDQIQVIGSHNSYHLEAVKRESNFRKAIVGDTADALEYTYASVGQQLGQFNVRQLEFDVWFDPEGGLYAKPLIRTLTLGGSLGQEMRAPGNKVLHIQDIDYHSNCVTFRECLQEVKTWSDRHPEHIPITFLIEFKDTPLTWTAAQKQEVREQQAEITEGKPASERKKIVASVKEALLADPVPWTSSRMDTVDADIARSSRPRRSSPRISFAVTPPPWSPRCWGRAGPPSARAGARSCS